MPSNNNVATAYLNGDVAERWGAIAASGAATQCSGTLSITGAAAVAVALAAPVAGRDGTAGDDGKALTILCETPHAHTVSVPGGLNGVSGNNLITFGAAVGNNVCLVARNGYWWLISSIGATIT